jgi:hypothetical protein
LWTFPQQHHRPCSRVQKFDGTKNGCKSGHAAITSRAYLPLVAIRYVAAELQETHVWANITRGNCQLRSSLSSCARAEALTLLNFTIGSSCEFNASTHLPTEPEMGE